MKNLTLISTEDIYTELDDIDIGLENGNLTVADAKKRAMALLTIAPEPYWVNLKLAELSLFEGRLVDAERYVLSCHHEDQANHRHVILLSIVRAANGDMEQAQQILDGAEGVSTPAGNAYFAMICQGLLVRQASLFKISVSVMTRFTTPSSENLGPWIGMCMEAKLTEEGLALSELLVQERPNVWTSYIGPAYFHQQLGNNDKAMEYLRNAESFPQFRSDEITEGIKSRILSSTKEAKETPANEGSVIDMAEVAPDTAHTIRVMCVRSREQFEVVVEARVPGTQEFRELLPPKLFLDEKMAHSHYKILIYQLAGARAAD